eukprot:6411958-Alexandrium_andersonii.AAC.1
MGPVERRRSSSSAVLLAPAPVEPILLIGAVVLGSLRAPRGTPAGAPDGTERRHRRKTERADPRRESAARGDMEE